MRKAAGAPHRRLALWAGAVLFACGVAAAAGAFSPARAVVALAPLVLGGLALLLDRTRWTELLRLRVTQLATAGATTAALGAILPWGPATVTGLVLLALATATTAYGVLHFPTRH